MNDSIVKTIAANGIVAAIYFLLTFLTSSFSFMGMQIRIAEMLILLCFFRRDYTIGITIGCAFANIISPLGGWDVLFGTLATLLSCILVSFSKHLLIASIFPVIINAFVVGTELYILLQEPFWINVGLVAAGEAIAVIIIGYIFFILLGKKEFFRKAIRANRNFHFKW